MIELNKPSRYNHIKIIKDVDGPTNFLQYVEPTTSHEYFIDKIKEIEL